MRHFLFFYFIFLVFHCFSSVTVYFNYGVFATNSSKPYLETYLTFSGNTVKYLKSNAGYQASVNISWKILKGSEIVKTSSYNLMSPKVNDTLNFPSFIDNQRFALENGNYTLELAVSDNAHPDQKTYHSQPIVISIKREKKVYSSDIQILESFSKSTTPSILTKNGYDLIPYNINYYPKSQNTIKFYFETYNLDTVLRQGKKFVYNYHIEIMKIRKHKMDSLVFKNKLQVKLILC